MGLYHPGDGHLGFVTVNIRVKLVDVLVQEFRLGAHLWSLVVIQTIKP